jgi:hypothetical protein
MRKFNPAPTEAFVLSKTSTYGLGFDRKVQCLKIKKAGETGRDFLTPWVGLESRLLRDRPQSRHGVINPAFSGISAVPRRH